MPQDSYKKLLRQQVIDLGINQEEIKYWDFLLDGFSEQDAKVFLERLKKHPALLPFWHHNLVSKCLFIKNKGTEKDFQKILKSEKEELDKI